jgi:(p)ppGpp synthase/HD superfamily hydrolase
MPTNDLKKAESVATFAHLNQTRWDGSPYIKHPASVVDRLKAKGCNNDTLIVGWLHDVVEDSKITIEEIKTQFGGTIARAIEALTHKKDESYANYIFRISLNHIAVIVKICDLEDNLSDLDPKKQKQRIDKYELAKMFLNQYAIMYKDFMEIK